MFALVLSVSALILSLFVLLAGNSLQFVILGLRAGGEGFSTLAIGGLAAAYYAGYALGTFRAPAFVRRVGHIRAFAGAGTVVSAVVLAHALWIEAPVWMALRFLTGMSFAVLATVAESWINARATREVRGQLLSIASIAAILGYAMGPLLVGLGPVDGYTLFVLASILMSIGLVPVLVTRVGPPPQPAADGPAEGYTLRRLYRETPLGLVGTMAIGALQGAFLGLGAVFAKRVGLTDNGASLFVTCALLAGMVAQYPLGWLSDRFDRRRVLAAATLGLGGGAALAAVLLAVAGPVPAVLALAAAVAGVAAMPLYAVVVAYVNDRLPETTIVPAAATLILSFSIGSVAAGPVASLAMDLFGPGGLLAFISVILAGLGAFSVLRMVRREDAPGGQEVTGWPGPEPSVFAASPVLLPMDWTRDEEQLAFEFVFDERQAVEDAAPGHPASGAAP